MKVFSINEKQNAVEALMAQMEKETGRKVFTTALLSENEEEQTLEVVVVFEDKAIMIALLTITDIDGNVGLRMQGNFI